MASETIYRGFVEKKCFKPKQIVLKDEKISGVWVEGVYFQKIKRNPCPIDDYVKPDDIEHLIIFNGFSDWNLPSEICQEKVIADSVCRRIDQIVIKGCHPFEKDIISFHCEINGVHRKGVGYLIFDHDDNVVVMTSDNNGYATAIPYNTVSNIKLIGNCFENPDLLTNMKLIEDGVNGKVVNLYWDNTNGLTFYVIVQDDSGRLWKFGGLDLNNKFAARWVKYMIDMFNCANICDNRIIGKRVFLALENNEPVARAYSEDGLKIIDLRNFFDED